MVEPLLYAALGFLTASLLALFFGRALWNRAVRLTTHRIMRRLPLSREEIVASRDLLRAEQAVEYRRLERQANLMRERMGTSMAAVGERDARIAELRTVIAEGKAQIAAGERREAEARAEISRLEAEQAQVRGQLADTERSLTIAQHDLAQSQADRADLLQLADTRRAELAQSSAGMASLRQAAAALEQQLGTASSHAADAQGRLEAALAAKRLETERAEKTHEKLLAAESRLAEALTQIERGPRNGVDAAASPRNGEDFILLRQQIEKLARDIARAAGPAGAQSSPPTPSAPAPIAPEAAAKPPRNRRKPAQAAAAAPREEPHRG
jgi:chromosome segregation ATPase